MVADLAELVPGQGHFVRNRLESTPVPQRRLAQRLPHPPLFQGPDALPGDARWRRGEAVSLEASRNSMVSIEAAAQSQLVFTRTPGNP